MDSSRAYSSSSPPKAAARRCTDSSVENSRNASSCSFTVAWISVGTLPVPVTSVLVSVLSVRTFLVDDNC